MLEYAPFKPNVLWDYNTQSWIPGKKMIQVSYLSGSIKDHDFPKMTRQGEFLFDGTMYWLKNDIFDYDIKFTGVTYGSNSDSGFEVYIPRFQVHSEILGNRLAGIMHKANVVGGVLKGSKWAFGRRGPACFIEFK